MHPVQPGWVIVPVTQEKPNEWYHLIGWTESPTHPEPFINTESGIARWTTRFGEDPYVIATLKEWVGE